MTRSITLTLTLALMAPLSAFAQEAPTSEAPAEAPASEEAPVEEAAGEDAPAEEAPADQASAEDPPAEDEPTDDPASAEDAPAEEEPADEPPQDGAPVEEAPASPPAPAPVAGDPAGPPEAGENPARDDDGRALMTGWSLFYGGYAGATTGYLVGEALETEEYGHTAEGVAPGLLLGAAAGGVTGWLVTRENHISMDEAAFLWTGSGVGVFYGVQLGRAFIPPAADGATERVHAAGLAGSMAGTGIAMATKAPTVQSQMSFNLATGVGALAAAGVSDAAGLNLWDNSQERAGINLVGAALFGGTAGLHSSMGGAQPNAGAWALGLGHGAWIGGMTPYLFTNYPDASQTFGGVRAGLGVGYAGALLMAAAGNPDGRSVALQTVGIGAGSALGAGIPLAVGEEGTAASVIGPMLAGGVVGQVAGAAVAPHYELDDNDAFLLGTIGTWTTYQAAGWATYATATGSPSTRSLGYALTTGGAGTLLGVGLAPVLDVTPQGSAMLLAGGGWGTWYGGWSATMANSDTETAWLAMLGTGNGALLATAVAQGAGWDPTWRDVGVINGSGLLGAAGGGLFGVIALYEEDNWTPMVGSIVVGSTVGLGTGIVLSVKDDGQRGRGGLPAVNLGRGRYKPSVTARPWMSEDGKPGVYGEVRVDELARR